MRKNKFATGQNFCLRVDEMIEEMCEEFADRYFWVNAKLHIIWDSVEWMFPWPIFVEDYFFTLEDVYSALWYDIPYDCLIKYHEYMDDVMYEWELEYNLKNFYLLKYNNACEDKSEKKENGYWSTTTDWPYQRPKWWISQWPTAIWPFVWDYPYSPDWYPTTITLCNTTKCRSVKLSCNDDSDDEPAVRNDENDGWENEEVRGAERKHCCKRWGCWRNSCNKWRQHSHL